jgi:hypothetical protein
MISGMKALFEFRDYNAALRSLEQAFQFAGEQIEFRLGLHEGRYRYVEILHNGELVNTTYIKDGSPAQAIKDVAGEVPL